MGNPMYGQNKADGGLSNTALGGVKELTGASTLKASDSGSIFVLADSTGFTTTLPPALPGMRLKFVVGVASTDAGLKITVNSGDYFYGGLLAGGGAHATAGSVTENNCGIHYITRATAAAAAGSYDHILLDGDATTTGAYEGTWLELICTTKGAWNASGVLVSTGTVANPAPIYAG